MLDDTYERLLQEIKEANWKFVHCLFQCVAVAFCLLCVEELVEFLAFDFKAGPIPKFHEDWRLKDPANEVLSTCSSLLSIVNMEGSSVIQFSHVSVKEFLTSTRLAETSDIITRRFHISLTSAHTLAAQACLGILLHLDKNITRNGLQKFPLAKYASRYLVGHARFENVLPNLEHGMKHLFDRTNHILQSGSGYRILRTLGTQLNTAKHHHIRVDLPCIMPHTVAYTAW